MRGIFTAVLIGGAVLATAAMAEDSYMVVPKASQKLKPTASGFATQVQVLRRKNAQVNISLREKNGQAEQHAAWEDNMIILEGEGTLTLGGSLEKLESAGPGETRGASIKGGKIFMLHAGDYIYVPINTPHQMMVATGKSLKYATVKTHP